MQYEDATDSIQTIREKLELERAAKLEWLRSAATACARSFSAAANGHAQVGILVTLKSRHCGSNNQRYLHSVSKASLSLGMLACHGGKCPGLHCAECHHDFIAGEWAWGQRGQPGHCPVATTHAAGAERAQSQQAAGQAPLLDNCFQGCSSCAPIKLPRPDASGAVALCSQSRPPMRCHSISKEIAMLRL